MRLVAASAVLVFVSVAILLAQTPAADKKQPDRPSIQKWEYKAVGILEIRKPSESLEATEERLDAQFGAEGWELCGADSGLWIFKRPKH